MENTFVTKIKDFGTSMGVRIPHEQAKIFNYNIDDIIEVTIIKVIIPKQEEVE